MTANKTQKDVNECQLLGWSQVTIKGKFFAAVLFKAQNTIIADFGSDGKVEVSDIPGNSTPAKVIRAAVKVL